MFSLFVFEAIGKFMVRIVYMDEETFLSNESRLNFQTSMLKQKKNRLEINKVNFILNCVEKS